MSGRRKVLLTCLLLPALVRAQTRGRQYRIGFLGVERDWPIAREAARRLGELGYVEGQNLTIEYRYLRRSSNALPRWAHELVRLRVEVIVAWGVLAVLAARDATTVVPIVMVYGADPLGLGFVQSLARPGGNITGLGWGDDIKFVDKLAELVRAAMPAAKSLGMIWNLEDRALEPYLRSLEASANALGFRTIPAGIREGDDIPGALQRVKAARADATIVLLDHLTLDYDDLIEEHAKAHGMPLVTWGGFGFGSAVLKVGPHVAGQPRRAAEYAARILNGARPGDLPVERSQTYELSVNLKAARALNLVIPETFLLRADKVIR